MIPMTKIVFVNLIPTKNGLIMKSLYSTLQKKPRLRVAFDIMKFYLERLILRFYCRPFQDLWLKTDEKYRLLKTSVSPFQALHFVTAKFK